MNIIQKQPNPSGAYPPIQEDWIGNVPDTHYEITCNYSEFYNGFIIPIIEDSKVTGYVCNTEAWSAWKAEEAAKIPVTPEPTAEEKLRADVDFLAMVTGVDL